MAWELMDTIKITGFFSAISTSFMVNRIKIKSLMKKTESHDKVLHGDDDEGGLITKVNVMNTNISWIRDHLENGKK